MQKSNKNKDNIVRIYTDGACSGNPGKGGIGVILTWNGKEKEISQGYSYTTNNRMELLSVIVALESLKKDNLNIEIYSDSKYVVDSVENAWLFNWVKNNFKGKANVDLWKRFLELSSKHKIKFIWVKGHADNPFNNRCDRLAVSAYNDNNLLTDLVKSK